MSEEILALGLEAEKKFRQAASTNEDLAAICQAQGVIIEEIANSLPDATQIAERMNEMNKEMELIDSQIRNGQAFLLELLTSPENKTDNVKPGNVLKSVIENTIDLIFEYCHMSAKNGEMSVSLLQILDIEDQITKLIHEMEERNMYPETEAQIQMRNNRTKSHNEKIVGFLQLLKQVAQNK